MGDPCNRTDSIHEQATAGGSGISLDEGGISELEAIVARKDHLVLADHWYRHGASSYAYARPEDLQFGANEFAQVWVAGRARFDYASRMQREERDAHCRTAAGRRR